MRFLSAFEFLFGYLKESEASGFSVVKAKTQLAKLPEKLLDLKKTGNNIAEILLNKLQDLTVKNSGLTTTARKAMGKGASDFQEITIHSFAPCTSVSAERFFFDPTFLFAG